MLRGMTLAALAVNCSLTASALAQNRPNLIFILTDDQGVDAIQWPLNTGHPSVQTPTMNALAAQGVSFANCRVNPNCSPTRACLMTGRYAIDTGVCGVLGRYIGENPCPQPNYITGMPAKVTNRLALQTQEKTLAEVLANLAEDEYYTVLIDKWHLGYNQDSEDLDLLATDQGFHKHVDWLDTICNDDPDETGDEHMTYAYQQALYWLDDQNRDPEHQGKPYALFFHTVSPHRRHADSGGYHWWAVANSLIPLTQYNQIRAPDAGGQRDRAIQNLEAIDTTIMKLLRDLGVIEQEEGFPYIASSDTVVFFMSDNGTDPATCWFGNGNAKNTLYDGGIRVPMFVMGEGISTEQGFAGTVEYRPVTHVDVFETVCDIVDASASERGNDLGAFPRRSITFADAINWGDPPVEEREFTLCSLGESDSGTQTWKVALIWGDQWKLICASGGAGFADMETDEFYNLLDDPLEETNLIESNMSVEEATVYFHLRDRIVDEWPAAVSQALPAQPTEFHVDQYAYFSPTSIYVLVVFVENEEGEMTYVGDEFYDHYNDPDHYCDLNLAECRSMTQWEQNLRDSLRAQMMTAVADGSAGPDVRVVDIALSSSLVMKDDLNSVSATQPLTVGHQNVGGGNEQVE